MRDLTGLRSGRLTAIGAHHTDGCRWATVDEQANNKRQWGTVAPKKFKKTKRLEV